MPVDVTRGMHRQTIIKAVLLPGLDGTGRNFGPFMAKLPDWLQPIIIAYPTQQALGYAQLVELILPQLPEDAPYILIAESFAGPLALQLSTHAGANLKALVLCATFVSNPRPHLARLAPLLSHESLLSVLPPKWLVRYVVTGFDASNEMLEQLLEIHKQVAPHVWIHRLHQVIQVDVRKILRHCRLPVLHLYAKQDHTILQGATREIQAIRPDIPSIGIEGPHFLLQTRATQCVAAIEKFMNENSVMD